MAIVKTISLGGRTVPIEGSGSDPYFQSIDVFAAQTGPLSRFVAEYVDDGLIIDVGGEHRIDGDGNELRRAKKPNHRVRTFS